MSHIGDPHWVDLLGLFAGAFGVCAAVWLQLITPRQVRSRYVLGFLVLGCLLMLVNLEPVIPEQDAAVIGLRVLAYFGLIAAQGYLAYRVWQDSEIHPLGDAVEAFQGAGK